MGGSSSSPQKPLIAVHKAAASGHLTSTLLRSLPASGADVNERVALPNDKAAMRSLIGKVIMVPQQSEHYLNLLHVLVHELHADPCIAAKDTGRTPLMDAAELGLFDAVALLGMRAEVKASLDQPDAQGYSALMLATAKGHGLIVRWLLWQAGASLDAKSKSGQRAIDLARTVECTEALQLASGRFPGKLAFGGKLRKVMVTLTQTRLVLTSQKGTLFGFGPRKQFFYPWSSDALFDQADTATLRIVGDMPEDRLNPHSLRRFVVTLKLEHARDIHVALVNLVALSFPSFEAKQLASDFVAAIHDPAQQHKVPELRHRVVLTLNRVNKTVHHHIRVAEARVLVSRQGGTAAELQEADKAEARLQLMRHELQRLYSVKTWLDGVSGEPFPALVELDAVAKSTPLFDGAPRSSLSAAAPAAPVMRAMGEPAAAPDTVYPPSAGAYGTAMGPSVSDAPRAPAPAAEGPQAQPLQSFSADAPPAPAAAAEAQVDDEEDDEDGNDDGDDDCVVCLDQKPSFLVMPCRHLCLCKGCARGFASADSLGPNQVGQCPICREQIKEMFSVFRA